MLFFIADKNVLNRFNLASSRLEVEGVVGVEGFNTFKVYIYYLLNTLNDVSGTAIQSLQSAPKIPSEIGSFLIKGQKEDKNKKLKTSTI